MAMWNKKIDGIIALVLGLIVLIFPFKVFTILSLFVGVGLVIGGFKRLHFKITTKNKRVVNSLLMIVIGIVLLLPNSIIPDRDVLGYLLGGMLIYNGSYRMIKYRKVQTPMNRSLAGAGLAAILFGVVIVLVPEIVILAFTITIGLILLGYGSIRLFVKMNFMGKFNEFRRSENSSTSEDVVDVDVEN